jgi:hypothetical protein
VTTAIPDELTTIELLVLWEAGGENTLGDAYGAVQLYAVFERERSCSTPPRVLGCGYSILASCGSLRRRMRWVVRLSATSYRLCVGISWLRSSRGPATTAARRPARSGTTRPQGARRC